MKYFEVQKEVLIGTLVSGLIASDGEYINLPDDIEQREITTGFSVLVLNEQGMTESVDYRPVKTDMESWENNEEKVLNDIREYYSADKGWQNNNW